MLTLKMTKAAVLVAGGNSPLYSGLIMLLPVFFTLFISKLQVYILYSFILQSKKNYLSI